MEIVDLHTHSIFSDGALAPNEYAERLYRERAELQRQGLELKAVALTDHESMNSIEPLARALQNYEHGHGITNDRVLLLSGIEISAFSGAFSGAPFGMEIHVLGYFPHADLRKIDSLLRDACESNFRLRKNYYRDNTLQMFLGIIARRMPEITGEKINYNEEEINRAIDRLYEHYRKEKLSSKPASDIIQWEIPFQRQIVRQAIEEAGIMPAKALACYTSRNDPDKILEAYYLQLNRTSKNQLPADEIRRMADEDASSCIYTPGFARQLIPVERAVSLIVSAGGKPFFAHPYEFIKSNGEKIFEDFVKNAAVPAGLAGIECYYPEHNAALTSYLLEFVLDNKLLASGGTDNHMKKEHEKFGVGYTGLRIPFTLYERIVE